MSKFKVRYWEEQTGNSFSVSGKHYFGCEVEASNYETDNGLVTFVNKSSEPMFGYAIKTKVASFNVDNIVSIITEN